MRITLTQRVFLHKGRAYDCTDQVWHSLLSDHTLFFLPNTLPQNIDAILDRTDLLILTGGNRIFPGQNYNENRQQLELALIDRAIVRRLPVVGICRGFQLLTDHLGGHLEPVMGHNGPGSDHPVRLVDGTTHVVNSYHGLKVTDLPKDCISLAVDDDGNCEAWVHKEKPLGGTMWHPERMDDVCWPDLLNVVFEWPGS